MRCIVSQIATVNAGRLVANAAVAVMATIKINVHADGNAQRGIILDVFLGRLLLVNPKNRNSRTRKNDTSGTWNTATRLIPSLIFADGMRNRREAGIDFRRAFKDWLLRRGRTRRTLDGTKQKTGVWSCPHCMAENIRAGLVPGQEPIT